MTPSRDAADLPVVPQPSPLPDLPTVVGLPGAAIELEVGGQVCLTHGDEWPR